MRNRKRFSPARQREYGHMESAKAPVIEIDPATGLATQDKEISKMLVVNHHMKRDRNPIEPLRTYKLKGIKNLTEEEIEIAYEIIKGFKEDRTQVKMANRRKK